MCRYTETLIQAKNKVIFGETEMVGKIIFEMESPKTQSVEAVESLAAYLNKPIEAGILNLGAVKLVKSNKGDVFYTVTAKACSCPSDIPSWPEVQASKEMLQPQANCGKGGQHSTCW